MPDDPIASLRVAVSADLSQLQDQLGQIPGLLAGVMGNLGGVSGAADTATAAFDGLGKSASDAQTSFDFFGQSVGGAADQARDAQGRFVSMGGGAGEAGEKAHESAFEFGALGEYLTALAGEAGLVFEAFEILKSSLEDFAVIQKASIALTQMTGDAEGTTQAIEGLKETAVHFGLPIDQLVAADQRMVAFGIDAAAIPGLMQGIIDASSATGNGFDQVANAAERFILSGVANNRQLVQLGVNLNDLADALNSYNPALEATAANASKIFKALGDGADTADLMAARVQIVNDLLAKHAGAGEAVASSLSNAWQRTKTDLGLVFEEIGATLAPLATGFLHFFDTVLNGSLGLLAAFKGIQESIQWLRDHVPGIDTTTPPAYMAGVPNQTSLLSWLTSPPSNNPLGGIAPNLNQALTPTAPGLGSVSGAPPLGLAPEDPLKAAQANLALIQQAYKDFAATADDVAAAQDAVTAAFMKANPQFQANSAFTLTAADLMGSLNDGTNMVDTTLNGLVVHLQATTGAWADNYEQLVKNADDARQLADLFPILSGELDKSTEYLTANGAVIDDNTKLTKLFYQQIDQLDKQGYAGLLKSIPNATQYGEQFHAEVILAVPDISELNSKLQDATAAYDQMSTATDANGQSLYSNYQLVQGQIAVLKIQIEQQTELGNNTDALRWHMEDLKNSLIPIPTLYDTARTAAKQLGTSLTTDLGNAITGVITGTESITKAFQKMADDVVSIIVNNLIKLGMQKLLDSIAQSSSGLAGIATALGGHSLPGSGGIPGVGAGGGVLGTGVGAGLPSGGGGGIPGLEGGPPLVGGEIPAGASGGGLASTVGGDLLSGVTSAIPVVGMVAAVGSLISGIVSNFQQATMNDTLWRIMSNTLGIFYAMIGTGGLVQSAADLALDFGPGGTFQAFQATQLWPELVTIEGDLKQLYTLVGQNQIIYQALQAIDKNTSAGIKSTGSTTVSPGAVIINAVGMTGQQIAEALATYLGLTVGQLAT